jgi:HlyD family secretion protein
MKNKKITRYVVIAAVVFVILAIVGKQMGWFGKSVEIKVSTEIAEKRNITEVITANGKIHPETEVKISPDVSGEIVELNVREGDEVVAGQLLARIRPDNYISMRDRAEAALNTAKAQLANAKARQMQVEAQFEQSRLNFERNEKLWEQKAISEAEFQNARSAFQVSKADVEAARQSVISAEYSVKSSQATLTEAIENLQKTSIFSPMTGTVSQLLVEQGERVVGTAQFSGTEMMRVANLNRMQTQVQVNENDIVRVKLNDTALIEIDAYLGETFKGIVTEIAKSANVSGLTTDQVTNFEVKILILQDSYTHLLENHNKKYPFLPGMSATVDIQTNTRYDVLSVPIQSVTSRTDTLTVSTDSEQKMNEIVFLVEENVAKIREIKTGIQDNNYIEVLSGLEEGEIVVAAPFSAISRVLNDGTNVTIVKREDLYGR